MDFLFCSVLFKYFSIFLMDSLSYPFFNFSLCFGFVCLFVCLFVLPLHLTCEILVPQAGIEPRPLAEKVLSPNHWTVREFPLISSLNNIFGIHLFVLFQFSSCIGF